MNPPAAINVTPESRQNISQRHVCSATFQFFYRIK